MKLFVNILTSLRIIGTIFLPLVWYYFSPLWIFVYVALLLFTDFLDGKLARLFHVQTLFGCVLDAIADKIFGVVIILIIAHYYPIFYIMAILEIIIGLTNLFAAFRGATTKSSFIGKFKMWVISLSILIGLLCIFNKNIILSINVDWIINMLNELYKNKDMALTIAASLSAGSELIVAVDYTRHILKELKNKNEKIKYNFKSNKDLKYVLFDTEYFLENKNSSISASVLK